MRVEVVRPLLWGGVRQEVGAVLDIEDGKAIEAIATGRVKRAGDLPPSSPSGPMTMNRIDKPAEPPAEAAAEPVVGKKRKGAKEDSNVAS